MPLSLAREQQQFPTRNYPYRARAAHEAAAPDGVAPQPGILYRRVGRARPCAAADDRGRTRGPRRSVRAALAIQAGRFRFRRAACWRRSMGWPPRTRCPINWFFSSPTAGTCPGRRKPTGCSAASASPSLAAAANSRVDVGLAASRFDRRRGVRADHRLGRRARGISLLRAPAGHFLLGRDVAACAGGCDSRLRPVRQSRQRRAGHEGTALALAALARTAGGINEEAFAPDDPLRNDPVFRARVTAERLETEVVRPAIRRWNEAGFARRSVTMAFGATCSTSCARRLRHHRQPRHLGDREPDLRDDECCSRQCHFS